MVGFDTQLLFTKICTLINLFATSNAKEADCAKLSRSWDIRIMDTRDAQKYHDVDWDNAVSKIRTVLLRGWCTSEPKQAENNITAAPHRCYGRLPITRQLRKACPRLYRGQLFLVQRPSESTTSALLLGPTSSQRSRGCRTQPVHKIHAPLLFSKVHQKCPGSQKCPGRQAFFYVRMKKIMQHKIGTVFI